MKPVFAAQVEKTGEHMASIPDEEANALAIRMGNEQPVVVTFVMAVDQDIISQEEREVLFYLSMVIWQVMSQENKRLPRVTVEQMEKADEDNTTLLESMMDKPDSELTQEVEKLVNGYHQPAILRYAVEALVEAADEQEIKADNIGILLVDLKSIIDCFDQ